MEATCVLEPGAEILGLADIGQAQISCLACYYICLRVTQIPRVPSRKLPKFLFSLLFLSTTQTPSKVVSDPLSYALQLGLLPACRSPFWSHWQTQWPAGFLRSKQEEKHNKGSQPLLHSRKTGSTIK